MIATATKRRRQQPQRRWALIALPFLPALALAQADSEPGKSVTALPQDALTMEQCALIENGAKRLACFDTAISTEERATSATPEQRQQVEQATELLAPKSGGEIGATEEDGIAEALVSRHLASEEAFMSLSGNFLPHRQTYLMPYTYVSSPNQRPHSPSLGFTDYDYDVMEHEVKFQISFKVPLLPGLFDKRSTLWFGYTQLSLWQLYNTEDSAPFRETNYQPELFYRYDARLDLGPGRLDIVTIGLNHQSNGRTEPQSRSWNRITANLAYGVDRWLFIANPWYRIPENSREDNNPDLTRYVGYGDYWAIYKVDETQSLSLRLRNNFRSHDNKTTVELGYSFPLGKTTKGYVQYFNGYGESLVDYNVRIHRIGIGIMLHDWL